MSFVLVIFLLLSLGLGGLAYFVTSSLLIAVVIALGFLVVFLFLVFPSIKKFQNLQQKQHECYLFVNSFLITLSVCQSIEKSYESAIQNVTSGLKETTDAIAHLGPKQRIDYLSNYFEMPIYDMFLSVLNIYLEQGGDILKLSKTLMEELTRIEETQISLSKNALSVLLQWIVLWAMSFAILGFARFGLNSFYSYLVSSPTYILVSVLYFVLLAFSIVVFTAKYTGVLPWKAGIKKFKVEQEEVQEA